ncbi:MAG: aldehyde dehydrogenase family protein [Pseudomonadota bacterium]
MDTSKANSFYIDGGWVAPVGAHETIAVVNPATEQKIADVALGTPADLDRAVAAARRAFPSFSQTSVTERRDLLGRIGEAYKARFNDMGAVISEEMGAPISFATRMQAGAGLSHFKVMAKLLEDYPFEETRGTTTVLHQPIGVIGMITPWNWPANQMACKVAGAIGAGATLVLKPSEVAPFSALLLAEILHDAGVPQGVFNLVCGDGPGVGQAMAAHPDIDCISFTGSTGAGIDVARRAAPTVKRVGQELGGKAPNIILDDADFPKAVRAGVELCFRNAGQSCNAPTRMLVPKDRMDEAAGIAADVADTLRVGAPSDPDTQMGPVVSLRQWSSIQELIRSGLNEGARCVAGGEGRPNGLSTGYYVKPTVFADVDNAHHRIAREEIFGPVLSIIGYGDDDDAVAIANDSPFGLAAYVSGGDLERARGVARRLQSGMVHINEAPADPTAPFGGVKQSGNGREWGAASLEEYLETKSVMGWTPRS